MTDDRLFLHRSSFLTHRFRLVVLVVLRVAAPSVPAVGVAVAGLEADEQAVGRARVDVAFGEHGLEGHGLIEGVAEARRAVLLADGDDVPDETRQVHVRCAERGRREDLRLLLYGPACYFGAPTHAPVRRADRV